MIRWVDPVPPGSPDEPWDDERLDAAFRDRYERPAPSDLAPIVLAAVTAAKRPRLAWLPRPRVAQAAAAIAVVVAGSLVGVAAVLQLTDLGPLRDGGKDPLPERFVVRDGPGDRSTFDAGGYAFEFPRDWIAYDTSEIVLFSGPLLAVLSSRDVAAGCDPATDLIECLTFTPLAPGEIRMTIRTGSSDGVRALLDPDPGVGSRVEAAVVGGMPARREEPLDGRVQALEIDRQVAWSIARPDRQEAILAIHAAIRGPAVEASLAVVDELLATLRFDPPPQPLPADPERAVEAGLVLIRDLAAQARNLLPDGADPETTTWLDCFPDRPGVTGRAMIRVAPDGQLATDLLVTCAWRIEAATGSIWELTLDLDWAEPGRTWRYTETVWLDAEGTILGVDRAGFPPPPVDGPPVEPPLPSPAPGVEFSVGATVPVENREVRLDIVDRSGRVVGAQPFGGRLGELDLAGRDAAAIAVAGEPRSLVVAWRGHECDTVATLTIQPDGRTATLDAGVRRGCDGIEIRRAVQLAFDRDTDAGDIAIGLRQFTRTGDEAWFLDLPILTVSEAIALGDLEADDREIAVGGWYAPAPGIRCLVQAPGAFPLLDPPTCPFEHQWLMESPEPLDSPAGLRAPVGPALHPIVPAGDRTWSRAGLDQPDGPPRLVVVLGHFDDRRAPSCGPEREAICRDRFVISAVLWVDGAIQPLGDAPRLEPIGGGTVVEPRYSVAGMRALMAQVIRPAGRLLALDPVVGSRLGEIEPALGAGRHPLARERVVWIARALDISDQGWIALRTYLVVDGATDVHEATRDGIVELDIEITY